MDLSSNELPSDDSSILLTSLINRLETTGPSTSIRDNRQSPLPPMEISGVALMPPRAINVFQNDDSDSYNSEESIECVIDLKCSVCYESKCELDTIISECKHVYCRKCFFEWLKTSPTCAICRRNFGNWEYLSDGELEPCYTSLQKKYKKYRDLYRKQLDKLISREIEQETLEKKNNELIQRQLRLRNMIDYTKGYNSAIKCGNLQINPLPCHGEFRRGYLDAMYQYNINKTNELKNIFGSVTTNALSVSKERRYIKRRRSRRKKNSDNETSSSDEEERSSSDEEEILLETVNSTSSDSPTPFFSSSTDSSFSTQTLNSPSSEMFIFRGL